MSEFDPVSYIMGAKSAGGGGGGGSGLPAVSSEDIGKALMVQEVKQFITIVPPQNITFPVAPDPEDPQFVDIEVQTENSSLLVAGGVYRQTVIVGGDTFVDYVVAEEDDGRLWVGEFINKNLETGKVYASGSETEEEPFQLVISVDKETTPTAEWGKQFPVMISRGTINEDIITFDVTFKEVAFALDHMPVVFLIQNDTYPEQYYAYGCRFYGGKYRVRVINTSSEFIADTEDDYVKWHL